MILATQGILCFHVAPRILSLSPEPTVDFEPWSFLENVMVMGGVTRGVEFL